jgi:hypothetical protein
MLSFDLQAEFYAFGINLAGRSNCFTVNVRGQLFRFEGLPMGWSMFMPYFYKLALIFLNNLRAPNP